VNCYTGKNEIEVMVNRVVEDTYDPNLLRTAEERQRKNLEAVKRERGSRAVSNALHELKRKARDESANLMPAICGCVEAEVTLQEICDVLREVFGEARPVKI
jgi:methylmalonyl-CoA mutase N-terminal domain/subunit